ncbi:MAG: DPP IV N-terminal domain-containing protein, partial [Rubricoccaceae bacterium]|nr:DPP IV N-terminal domain-containing protein [Rubricoccaceae bacterium]
LDGSPTRELLRGPAQAWYANGYVLFLRENTLMAQGFDPGRLELTSEAVPVADGVRLVGSIPHAVFSVSQAGHLVYMTGAATEGSVLRWRDKNGDVTGTTGELAVYGDFQVSHDGKHVCIEVFEGGGANADLWIYDVDTDIRTRFTFDPANDFDPVWSRDGSEIIFCSDRTGQFQFYRKTVASSEPEVMIYENPDRKNAYDWSADGRYLLFHANDSTSENSIWMLDLEKSEARRLTEQGTSCFRPYFSPDERWFVFSAFENGKRIVYARSFPQAGRKWQISSGEGLTARWPDSGNIFYQTVSGEVVEAQVTTTATNIILGKETRLFETRAGNAYNVLEDGSSFIEVYDESSKLASPLTLVVNWLEDVDGQR